MGYYVNPHGQTKEAFLEQFGQPGKMSSFWEDTPSGKFPVVLMNNGHFTSAGIAFSEAEFSEFMANDGRMKKLYYVDAQLLASIDKYGFGDSKEYKDFVAREVIR